VKKAKIEGGDSKVHVLVKSNAVEIGTNFLEAARLHTSEGGTIIAKTIWAFGFNYDKQ
jgi:hypothetical protein